MIKFLLCDDFNNKRILDVKDIKIKFFLYKESHELILNHLNQNKNLYF